MTRLLRFFRRLLLKLAKLPTQLDTYLHIVTLAQIEQLVEHAELFTTMSGPAKRKWVINQITILLRKKTGYQADPAILNWLVETALQTWRRRTGATPRGAIDEVST